MATADELATLPHIYVTPDAKSVHPPPPPGFVVDPTQAPTPPPPPGFVPDGEGTPTGQQLMGAYLNARKPPIEGPDATPNPDDVEADEKGVPERDAQPPAAAVPPPPPGYELSPAQPSVWDRLKTYPAHVVEGILRTLMAPGNVMKPNPYKEGTEEYDAYERFRQEGALEAARDIAMMTMGTGGIVGVPVKGAAETLLGAGPVRRVTPVTMPPPPRGFVLNSTPQALADDLQALKQSSVADRAEVGNTLKAIPDEAKGAAIGEKLYHAAEDPVEYAKLTPEEKALSDRHLDPLRQEQFDLALEAKNLGGQDLADDPNFMHRIAKGHAPEYDALSGSSSDPVTGTRGLSRTTSALQERKFYAIESPAGVRKVISPNDNGITVWNNRTGTSVPTSAVIKPGEVVDLNGKPWTVKPARTKEIEQHGQFAGNKPAEYHKNAFVNTADAVVRLREVVRNLKFIKEVKASPWWLQHAVKKGGNQKAPKGWVEPKMPQFEGWLVDPKIAHVLDDFYKPGLLGDIPAAQVLREVNQFATSSIFWNPIGHMQNVGVHWSVARGWDWIRPSVMRHFATDMTRAIKATVTQNHDYQRFLREGGGLVSGGVRNADFYREIGRHFGMNIGKNWGQWKPLFNKLGLKTPYEATAWWYDKMRNVLWQSSDMFMMHRYLELERKGMSTAGAIREAEKHIPNYRIPAYIGDKVLGDRAGRLTSMTMQEPALTNFARYHYGMWKSFMHMATDLAKGSPAEKKEALGNVAALAVMGYVVYPVLDLLYQKITGDPNAKLTRRGAMTVPHGAAEMSRDRESFAQFLQTNLTPAPATKEILQQLFPNDAFTGRPMGGPVQRVEHAAQALVSPYAILSQATRGAEGSRSPGRMALDTVVGGENTSERTEKGKQYGQYLRDKEAARFERAPTGPLSRSYYGFKNWIAPDEQPPAPAKKDDTPAAPKAKRSHHNKEKGY